MLLKDKPAFIQSYLEDSSNIKSGNANFVAIPESIGEISAFLKDAKVKKMPVTVSGARTGQSGGSIPFGGAVLSTEKLCAVKEIVKNETGGFAVAEAGVSIDILKKHCAEKRLLYTYDPTEQNAFVGGTVATNAAGGRSFRYGPTRKHVRALKLVFADGSIFSLRRGEIRARGRKAEFTAGSKHYKIQLPSYKMPASKHSAGYYAEDNMDLVDLFVGQEGTLAVIAETELSLVNKPEDFLSCFAFFPDEAGAFDFTCAARGLRPLSIEYFDGNSLGLLAEKYGNVPPGSGAAIFFEDEITKSEDAVIEKWEKALLKNGVPLDNTWIAMSGKAQVEFKDKRHFIPERMSEMAKASGFPKVSTDLAVPRENFAEMFKFYQETLRESGLRHFIFGHIGDSHLHVNMLPAGRREYDAASALELEFAKKSVLLGGTVSAEHGIGKRKKALLKILFGEKGIKEMIEVKRALDPDFILGRGNIFDV